MLITIIILLWVAGIGVSGMMLAAGDFGYTDWHWVRQVTILLTWPIWGIVIFSLTAIHEIIGNK